MKDPERQKTETLEGLVAEAADEFLERLQGGEPVSIEEFVRGYPTIASILRQLLPAVRGLHQTGEPPPSGGVSSSHRQVPVVQAPALEVPEEAPAGSSSGALGQLGDFRLLREIGRGGMGIVYEAEQLTLRRHVALKMLSMAGALDPRQLQRFRLEAQAAAQLHHDHIVAVYFVGSERGVPYYAMQFIEGQSLAEVIGQLQAQDRGKGKPLGAPASTLIVNRGVERGKSERSKKAKVKEQPPSRAATTVQSIRGSAFFQRAAALGIQAAEALEYAHGMGVVHRDIKPANLLVDNLGKLYVADFGLAQLRGTSGMTMTGDLVGTLRYMSPEQVQAQRDLVDHRTDVYSLGATLYELLTLTPVFDAPDRPQLMRQIAEEEPVPPRQRNSAIPVDLETIVLKALAKEPGKRYATAQELADDLRRFLEDRPVKARRPTPLERAAKWSRRHRSVVVSVLAGLLLTVVGLGISTAFLLAQKKELVEERNKTKQALKREQEQRDRAEKSFRLARQQVDALFELCEEELADKPEQQELRRQFLETILPYYQEFIKQSQDDPAVQEELVDSLLRVAAILNEIGSPAEALAALEQAKQLGEKQFRDNPAALEPQKWLSAVYGGCCSVHNGREFALLSQPAVQAELKFTPEQARKVKQLTEKRYDGFGKHHSREEWKDKFEELQAQGKALQELLSAEQTKRLRQIALQQRGVDALNDPAIAQALKLTPEQKRKLRSFHGEGHGLPPGPFRPGGFRPEEGRKPEHPGWNSREQLALNLLTEEQKALWREMLGPPFRSEFRNMPRGDPMRFPVRGPKRD